MRVGRRSPLPASAVSVASLIVLGVLAGCAGQSEPVPHLGDHEKTLRVYAAASGPVSGTFLTLRQDASATPTFKPPGYDVQDGLVSTAATLQGEATKAVEFVAEVGLPQDYHLNLSKSIIGVIYWSSVVTKAGGASAYELETAKLRAELWRGPDRVGGDESFYTAYAEDEGGEWQTLVVNFRPEVASLRKGDMLSLRILRFSGSSDLILGVGGPAQSYLEFHYFDEDPLAGGAYLEKGRLVRFAGGSEPPNDEAQEVLRAAAIADAEPPAAGPSVPPPPGAAPKSDKGPAAGAALPVLVGVPILGFTATRLRRRSTRTLLLVALLMGSLVGAGCLSLDRDPTDEEGETENERPEPHVTEEAVEDPDLLWQGVGAIEGMVKDVEIGIPVPLAHLSLVGTSQFTDTDRQGTYSFPGVPPGAYSVHVEADRYLSLDRAVDVEAGYRYFLNFSLSPPGEAGSKPHAHDYWDPSGLKLLFDEDVRVRSSQAAIDQAAGGATYYCATNANECSGSIQLPRQTTVPPGTGLVDVVLTWDRDAPHAPDEMGLRVQTSTNKTGSPYIPRGPGDPFHVAVFPNEADPGHNQFTQWVFDLTVRSRVSTYHQTSTPPFNAGDPVHVQIIAHKTVVPYEPGHRAFWGDETELALLSDSTGKTFGCTACDLPREDANNAYSWTPPTDAWVPPGATEVQGRVWWTYYGNLPAGYDGWGLSYHGADVPPARWHEGLKKATILERTPTSFTFSIPVEDDEADQFYLGSSNWEFYIDDNLDSLASGYSLSFQGYLTKFFIEAMVHKDPDYVEDSMDA